MSKSTHIEAVRQSLMDTLADLRNRENPMDIDRAKAVAHVASVLVDTAKVEIDFLKMTGQDQSSFLSLPSEPKDDIPRIDGPAAHNPFPTVVRHRLQG
jgi:hypothetical protein